MTRTHAVLKKRSAIERSSRRLNEAENWDQPGPPSAKWHCWNNKHTIEKLDSWPKPVELQRFMSTFLKYSPVSGRTLQQLMLFSCPFWCFLLGRASVYTVLNKFIKAPKLYTPFHTNHAPPIASHSSSSSSSSGGMGWQMRGRESP